MVNSILNIASAIVSAYLYVFAYSKISNKKVKYNIKLFLSVILEGIVFVLISKFVPVSYLAIVLNFVSLLLVFAFLFKGDISYLAYNTFFVYFLAVLFEVLLSFITSLVGVYDFIVYNKNVIFKFLFSFIDLYLVSFTLKNKTINKKLNFIYYNYIDMNNIFLLFLVFVLIISIDIKFLFYFSFKIYFINLIIFICFVIAYILVVYNHYKSKISISRIDTLLEFMKKYEKTIDDDSINRHEMLNNLLLLQSFEDKNNDEYNLLLSELIDKYNNKSINPIKNIYKLPSGLKGIIYYKMKDAEILGVSFSVRISNKINNRLSKLNTKEYAKLCKVIGIVLDNAIEAASVSKEKYVVFDCYVNNKNVEIMLSNSCKNNIDMKKIYNKNYSSKGKNRGFGLYLVNKILDDNEHISLIQECSNKIFTTSITIK